MPAAPGRQRTKRLGQIRATAKSSTGCPSPCGRVDPAARSGCSSATCSEGRNAQSAKPSSDWAQRSRAPAANRRFPPCQGLMPRWEAALHVSSFFALAPLFVFFLFQSLSVAGLPAMFREADRKSCSAQPPPAALARVVRQHLHLSRCSQVLSAIRFSFFTWKQNSYNTTALL